MTTQEITFLYEKRDGYAPVYCNGATGGINPQGELVIHFFNEHLRVPERDDLEVDMKTGDVVGGKTTGGGPAIMTRSVEAGVVMSLDSAERIIGWLTGMVNTAKALREKK